MRIERHSVVALVTMALGACSAPAQDDLDQAQAPIVGGQTAASCSWPTTVSYSASDNGQTAWCTATLIHPKVISIAGHCVSGGVVPKDIALGDTVQRAKAGRVVPIDHCMARPGGVSQDFAFCVLKEEVTDVPVIPVLFGCETSIIRPGQAVYLVGFGVTQANATLSATEPKRWVKTVVDGVSSNGYSVRLGDATHANCFGDSGGPAFVKLPDGTWRVFGATSTTGSPACGTPGNWAYLPTFIAWAEQQSGIDLTPCYDAATGAWDPGPDCKQVPTNPDVSDGTWAQMCNEKLTLAQPTMCGGVSDAGAPNVPDARTDARTAGTGGQMDGGAGSGNGGSGGAGGSTGGSAGRGGTGLGGGDAGGAGGGAGSGGGNSNTSGPGGNAGAGGSNSTTGGGTAGSGGGAAAGAAGQGGRAGSGTTGSSTGGAGGSDGNGCACRSTGSQHGGAGTPAFVALALTAWVASSRRRVRRA